MREPEGNGNDVRDNSFLINSRRDSAAYLELLGLTRWLHVPRWSDILSNVVDST